MEDFRSQVVDIIYSDGFINHAIVVCGNKTDAEDIIQDTAVKAFRYENSFTPGTNLYGWLFTIMRRIFIDRTRFGYYRFIKIYENPQLMIDDIIEPDVFINLEKKEVRKDLKRIKKQFSEPINLYLDGYSYAEISAIENAPEGTIKNRIFQGKSLLKEMYESKN